MITSGHRRRAPDNPAQQLSVADVLDRGDEAIADGEAIDLVRPLAGQLHVDDGDDPFAVAEVREWADNQCVARDLQEVSDIAAVLASFVE